MEVSDDDIAMGEQPGPLAQVDTVDRDTLTVALELPVGVANLPTYAATDAPSKHPLLRRWDHAGEPAAYGGALPITEAMTPDQGWIPDSRTACRSGSPKAEVTGRATIG